MRHFILLTGFVLLCFAAIAQQSGTMYVAAKTGLSMRDKPDAAAKVLEKIPYGTKITILQTEEEKLSIVTEGIRGYWQKVKFNNKTGYILDSYLFPWPPPKGSLKEVKDYFAQITTPLAPKLTIKSGSMNNIMEGGWELQKQYYKNGAEWHKNMGYEYGSDTYMLPGFTMEQGFLLVRMIAEFKNVFGEKDEFPAADKTYKKGEDEYVLKVDKTVYGEEYTFTNKITLEYTEGASYTFEMFMVGNHLVIVFGGGV
jgi:hypothetical protein